jgi:fatty-acyl-CoA synthase
MQIREHASGLGGANKPAVIVHPSGIVVTFDQVEARANRLAHFFRGAGLVEGDTVAILMENNEHIHPIMWAARRSGLYYVPINTHLTAAEAGYIITNSAAKAIIGSAALRKICENLPGGLPDVLMIADDDVDGWLRYPECVADQPDTPIGDEIEGDLLRGRHRLRVPQRPGKDRQVARPARLDDGRRRRLPGRGGLSAVAV